MQQPQRLLGKSDFKLLYGMVIIAHIVATGILRFELSIIIIASCSVFISLAIAFFKLFKKTETKKAFYWIWGVVSIFNAIAMSLYLSLFINQELKNKVLAFILCIIAIAIVGVITGWSCIAYNKKNHSDSSEVSSTTTSPKLTKALTTIGCVSGIFLIRSGFIPGLTHGHLILACCILIFSLLSAASFTTITFIKDYDKKDNSL